MRRTFTGVLALLCLLLLPAYSHGTATIPLQQLQGTLQNANEAQAFIQQREQQLKEQLMNAGVARQLLGINKESYYYQAQLSQYKDMLNSPDKIQQAVLSAVRQTPAFQNF